jgi:acyl-CoA synthetase (AMP-forming)/AMP-acid ligase II
VIFVQAGSLPKTSSGKLQRSLCKMQYADDGLTRA